jgi:hypothetical protein
MTYIVDHRQNENANIRPMSKTGDTDKMDDHATLSWHELAAPDIVH